MDMSGLSLLTHSTNSMIMYMSVLTVALVSKSQDFFLREKPNVNLTLWVRFPLKSFFLGKRSWDLDTSATVNDL